MKASVYMKTCVFIYTAVVFINLLFKIYHAFIYITILKLQNNKCSHKSLHFQNKNT